MQELNVSFAKILSISKGFIEFGFVVLSYFALSLD